MVRQDAACDWETNATWYDPSRHDVRFIVTPTLQDQPGFTAAIYKYFGRPAATYRETGVLVLVCRHCRCRRRYPAARPLVSPLPRRRAISQPGQREPVDFPVRSWYALSGPG